jgi:hypothetical protein
MQNPYILLLAYLGGYSKKIETKYDFRGKVSEQQP